MHKKQLIQRTQLYLGERGLQIARNYNNTHIQFAALRGGQQDQCVLAMDVKHQSAFGGAKEIKIADWNTNGRCRIWKATNPNQPDFYSPSIIVKDVECNSRNHCISDCILLE